jgi:hypothetical protein
LPRIPHRKRGPNVRECRLDYARALGVDGGLV